MQILCAQAPITGAVGILNLYRSHSYQLVIPHLLYLIGRAAQTAAGGFRYDRIHLDYFIWARSHQLPIANPLSSM